MVYSLKLECVIILLFKMLPQIRIFETFLAKEDFVHFCQPRLLFIDFLLNYLISFLLLNFKAIFFWHNLNFREMIEKCKMAAILTWERIFDKREKQAG